MIQLLPAEILVSVFEELADTPHLAKLRLVSQQFEDLAAPIFYRHITLTNELNTRVVPPPEPEAAVHHCWTFLRARSDLAYRKMKLHTKHLRIDIVIEWEPVIQLVLSLDKLQYITCSYWSVRVPAFHFQISSGLRAIHIERPHLCFLIDEFVPARQETTGLVSTSPPRVISCKLTSYEQWDFEANIKPLLAHPELHTLHLIGPLYSTPFRDQDVKNGDRMPPIKELVLQNYYWCHTPHVAVNFWNWTKLTHLELRDVCILSFLSTVPPEHLVQLRNLILVPRCKSAEQPMVSDLIAALLQKVQALERLSLRCLLPKVLPGIVKQGRSLRSLELENHLSFLTKDFDALSVGYMDSIRTSCPHLMEMSIQLHSKAYKNRVGELHMMDATVPRMRNLRRLRLSTCKQQVNLPSAENEESYHELHTAVRDWLHWFLATKKGAQFETVILGMRVVRYVSGPGDRIHASVDLTWTYEPREGISMPVFSNKWVQRH